MTIAFVRGANGVASSATSLTISFDATGCDAIVVGVRDAGTTSLVTGATYNGVAMTLAKHAGTDSRGNTMYVITGMASGTHNVVISFSGAQNFGAVVGGFSGVHQSTPVGNTNSRADSGSGGSGTNVPVSITCAAGSVAVDFFVLTKDNSTVAPTPHTPQTLVDGNLDSTAFYNRMSYSAGATSMAWDWDGPSVQPQAHSVIELKIAAAADTTPPTLSSAAVANATPTVVALTMSEAMDGAFVPAASAFAVSGHTVSSVAITGSTINLTCSAAFVNGEAARTVGYTQPGTNNARDLAGNLLVNFSAQSITNNVSADTTAPTATSAAVADATPTFVDITMSEAMNTSFTPASSAVTISGHTVTALAWLSSTVLRATVSVGFVNGESARTAAYTQPGTNNARDVAGNLLANFSGLAITNNVLPVVSLSSYFLSVQGVSNNYADRVRDTTSTTGTGVVTLANLTQLSYRTMAAAYAVGTSLIPYCIEDLTAGAWETGLGTLTTSTTFTRDTVIESSNGNAAVVFAAGTKNIFVTLTAAVVKRVAVKSYIDLRDYPVDPTFTVDSTLGIQAAINDAFLSNIPVISVPSGRYKISGALKSPDDFGRGCNGQLYIPASDHVAAMKSIRIIGESAPNWGYGSSNDEPVVLNGVIFESTLTSGTGTDPAVICASYGFDGGWGNFNFTDFTMENVCIRTNTASGANKIGGINIYNLSNGGMLHNVRVDVNRGLRTNPDPTSLGSCGIRTPRRDNSGAAKWGNVFVGGYKTGVVFSEHMFIDRLTIYGCLDAVDLQPAYHASWIGMLNVECCKNSITINGDHAIGIGTYDTEHDAFGVWFDFDKDIKLVASGSGGRKVAILSSTVVTGGVGIDDAGWNSSATSANYKVVAGAGAN